MGAVHAAHMLHGANCNLLTCVWPQGGGSGGQFSDRHTTDMASNMQSVLDRSDLDELMAMVGHACPLVAVVTARRLMLEQYIHAHALCGGSAVIPCMESTCMQHICTMPVATLPTPVNMGTTAWPWGKSGTDAYVIAHPLRPLPTPSFPRRLTWQGVTSQLSAIRALSSPQVCTAAVPALNRRSSRTMPVVTNPTGPQAAAGAAPSLVAAPTHTARAAAGVVAAACLTCYRHVQPSGSTTPMHATDSCTCHPASPLR